MATQYTVISDKQVWWICEFGDAKQAGADLRMQGHRVTVRRAMAADQAALNARLQAEIDDEPPWDTLTASELAEADAAEDSFINGM